MTYGVSFYNKFTYYNTTNLVFLLAIVIYLIMLNYNEINY